MSITKKQLEAISNTGQNEAIALAQVYRESFRQRLDKEMTNAINEEVRDLLESRNEVAGNVITTIALSYADSIGEANSNIHTVKLLKPLKSDRPAGNVKELLPVKKPRCLMSVS